LFDWNRTDANGKARPLHVRESLASIDWSRGPTEPLHVPEFTSPGAATVPLAHTPYFHLSFLKQVAAFPLGGIGRLQALCVFAGQARLESGEQLLPGQVWLLPAAMAPTACHPEASITVMLCELP
jgi:hypothetical protein